MKTIRRRAKTVSIGKVRIGGNNPVAIQSMTKTKTSNIEATVQQIKELESLGCDIVRLAIKDNLDVRALRGIKAKVNLPIVADIHFDWRLALAAIEAGVDKIRLNPGNIHKKEQVRQIIGALKSADIPLRIGVNSGSVRDLNSKRSSMPQRLVASALDYLKLIEGFKFHDIVISLKASNVPDTLEAYRMISGLCDYPLHLGVTATGLPYQGAIKSGVAIGALLSEGIGDTIRVSLTDNPQEEVCVAKIILESLGLRCFGPEIISCPTCGRCEVDLIRILRELEQKLSAIRYPLSAIPPLKLAIMGCVVNGPGEAREADIGVAFGKKDGLLFKKHKIIKRISSSKCIDILLKEIKKEMPDA